MLHAYMIFFASFVLLTALYGSWVHFRNIQSNLIVVLAIMGVCIVTAGCDFVMGIL